MRSVFQIGDRKEHTYTVKTEDVAAFNGKIVHPVCSTYTLAREMEWSGRLFVLEMIEPGEEGVGTMVEVKHRSPAKVGEILVFHAELMSADHKGNVICNVRVETSQGRVVAEGRTGQRILTREVINDKFAT